MRVLFAFQSAVARMWQEVVEGEEAASESAALSDTLPVRELFTKSISVPDDHTEKMVWAPKNATHHDLNCFHFCSSNRCTKPLNEDLQHQGLAIKNFV